jgi:carboxymethylenebutenolidase
VKVIDLAGNAYCPLYVVGGAEDQNPSPEVLAELGRRLAATGKDATVEIFDGAGHAFLADYRPSYKEPQAHDLWAKVIAFFHEHLG